MNSGKIAFTLEYAENALKKNHLKLIIYLIGLFFILLLSACENSQASAARAIEKYITTLSDKDSVQLSNLSCNAWQPDALVELDSLAGVGSKVENLACQQTGEDGADRYVSCSGILALDYNGEAQEIDLSARIYIARQEDGEWRMCGYH
jgi:hypothetical protein